MSDTKNDPMLQNPKPNDPPAADQGGQQAGPTPPAGPSGTINPFDGHRKQDQDTWFKKLAQFAPGTIWYAKRTGPPTYRGRRVKLGVFPRAFTGTLSPEKIIEVMGGGQISVTPSGDPKSDDAQWYGPIDLMWDDHSEEGLEPRADAAGSDDEEVMTYDQKHGMVKRRRADIEREAFLDEFRKAQKGQQELLQQLLQKLAAPTAATPASGGEGPKNGLDEFLKLERQRLENEAKAKAEDLKYLREKMEKDAVAAEQRFQAEKERLATERQALEQRLAQERALAETKAEKAHAAMLEIVQHKTNPLEQISTILGTLHEVQELVGGGAPASAVTAVATADDGAPRRPKQLGELVLEKVFAAADRIFPSIEPVIQHAVRTYVERTSRDAEAAPQTPAAPTAGLTGQPPPPALPAPAEARPAPAPAPARKPAPAIDPAKALGSLMADLEDGMNRNLPPRAVWDNVRASLGPVAEQLRAYTSVDQLAKELETLANAPAFKAHAEAIRSVARKAAGENRKWAEQFLDVARGSNGNGGNA